ncbi:MAG: IS66 family transposase [Planctomycetes bacterium]|nr:IS66 family transposase [Planctomycetota bacterium]
MDRKKAEKILAQGKEATILAMLELAAKNKALMDRVSELEKSLAKNTDSPSTPSGMKPPYEKPSVKGRRRKKAGRKKGHAGARRLKIREEDITQTKKHPLHACPHCDGPVTLLEETRDRCTEEIPEEKPEVTRHIQQVGYCKTCKKKVIAVVADALPGSTVGNRALVLTAWLHYGLGVTISHIVNIFNVHFHFPLSPGGLVHMWYRLAEILSAWYDEIIEQANQSAYLHADETGWRVNGVTHWLWCFTNKRLTCYLIHRSRGSPVLADFFGELFQGILISDFWGAYNKLKTAARQVCFVHLFRELEKVAQTNQTPEWLAFRKKNTRFLRDALRLDKNDSLSEQNRTNRFLRLHRRLDDILSASYLDPDCLRLVKRLNRHREDILTFLEHQDISADNNHGEREIRPAVIVRKNSYGNKSKRGADVQAILMTVYRTLKLRGLDPLETISSALKHYIETGALPPLPEEFTAFR